MNNRRPCPSHKLVILCDLTWNLPNLSQARGDGEEVRQLKIRMLIVIL